MESPFVRRAAAPQLSVELEGDLHAMELAIVALMATSSTRPELLKWLEELAVMADSFFPTTPAPRRQEIAARVREKLAWYAEKSGGGSGR